MAPEATVAYKTSVASGARAASESGLASEATVAYGAETANQVGTDRAKARDRRLATLAGVERALDEHAALGLARFWDEGRYRALGHVRGADYVQERLGMKPGKARWLVKLGRAIGQHAALRAALASGRLNASQVLELVPVVRDCSEAERLAWIDRAAPLTVSALRALVRAEMAKSGGDSDSGGSSGNDGAGGDGAGGGGDDGVGGGRGDGVEGTGVGAGEDAGQRFSIPAPARVGELWGLGKSLARKVAGHHLPAYGCAELIAAGYLSFVGDEVLGSRRTGAPRRGSPGDTLESLLDQRRTGESLLNRLGRDGSLLDRLRSGAQSQGEQPLAPRNGVGAQDDGSSPSLQEDAPAPQHDAAAPQHDAVAPQHDAAASPPPYEAEVAADFSAIENATDAWELHAALKRLEERRRRLRLELGQEFHQLNRDKGWSALGFDSLAHYCEQRLGLSKRRASDLIRIFCRLKHLKRLRRDYLSGAINYSKVRSLLRVVRPPTERLWLEWARGLSCREVDAITEYAQLYALGKMDAAALARAMSKFVAASGGESKPRVVEPTFAPRSGASGNADSGNLATGDAPSAATQTPGDTPPVGSPLPPLSRRSGPRIAGHAGLIVGGQNTLATRIRFWAPTPEAEVFQRALSRCRALNPWNPGDGDSGGANPQGPNPGGTNPQGTNPQGPIPGGANPQGTDPQGPVPGAAAPDWAYLEIILTHFILEYQTPSNKRSTLQYKILTRDDFLCGIPTCTSRANFHAHHIWWRSGGGPDDPWNLITLCAAHHQMVHEGIVQIGGWAPWALIIRQGVDPRNNRAADAFKNGRRTSDKTAREWMMRWRKWCRTRRKRTKQVAAS